MFQRFRNFAAATVAIAPLVVGGPALAAKPTVKQALDLTPVQEGVDYEQPSAADLEKCVIEGESGSSGAGWTVRNADGQLLRRFLDTNNDNKVDLWCYYKNGVEVYRDIDGDHNGKADQYRWLGTSGTRWGLDKDEDGRVDAWKAISAEEVTAEIVAALREKDEARFRRLLLTAAELKSLGLDEVRTKQLAERIAQSEARFGEIAQKQRVVDRSAKWLHFGGMLPGVVPAGSGGVTKDLLVYDNVAAVIESGGQHKQIGIGTLVFTGQLWRAIDLPTNLFENEVTSLGGFFFNNPLMQAPRLAGESADMDEQLQKLISRLEEVDRRLLEAPGPQQPKLNADRADAIEALIGATADAKERGIWIRQYADTVGAATQSGVFPDGVNRLKSLQQSLAKSEADREHLSYLEFRALTAQYALQMQEPSADFVKVQKQWLDNLADFAKRYPDDPDSAEAYLQLGMAYEFGGDEKDAIASYTTIIEKFPQSVVAKKAAGAKRRLESVGRTLLLQGQTADGKRLSLDDYRGQVVVLHYWATWCEPCKNDMKTLKDLQAKYAAKKFTPIGINLDSDRAMLVDYLKTNRLPWPQLHEEGGLDSRLSNELGVLSLPTMLLIDQNGRVVNRNLHISELAGELQKLLR